MPSNDTLTEAFEALAYACGRHVGHYQSMSNAYPRKQVAHVGAWELEANWRGKYRVLELVDEIGIVAHPLWDGEVSADEAYKLISVAHRAVNNALARAGA